MGYLTDLTDVQGAIVEPIIPPQEGPKRPRVVDRRRVIDAIQYLYRAGCRWRMIPAAFPPSGTMHYYFDKWNEDGALRSNSPGLDISVLITLTATCWSSRSHYS